MKALPVPPTVMLAALAAGGLAFYVWRKGGVQAAATAAGGAAVKMVDGAVTGVVGGLGEVAGLPTPAQTTTDEYVARWLIDTQGWFTASQWASAPALLRAAMLPSGAGRAPSAGSLLAAQFPTRQLTTGDFTRTDHDTTPVGGSTSWLDMPDLTPWGGGASGGW